MPFQQDVRQFATSGLPGEVSNFGPLRSHVWVLQSNGTNNDTNPIGFAYTKLADRIATPGDNAQDQQPFLGILIRPKENALQGNDAGTLDPTYFLRDNENGTLLSTGELWVTLGTTGKVGDELSFEIATGAIGSAVTWVPDGITYSAIPTGIIIEEDIFVADTTAKVRLTY